MPKSPKITDGIPARRFISCLSGSTSFFGQKAKRQTEVKSPSIVPSITDSAVTYSVATIMGSMP